MFGITKIGQTPQVPQYHLLLPLPLPLPLPFALKLLLLPLPLPLASVPLALPLFPLLAAAMAFPTNALATADDWWRHDPTGFAAGRPDPFGSYANDDALGWF